MCAPAAEGAFRSLAVRHPCFGWYRILRRPGAASTTSPINHCETSGFAAYQSGRSRSVKRENDGDRRQTKPTQCFSARNGNSRGGSLSLRRAYEKRNALFSTRPWSGSLLATQRLARDAAAGKADNKRVSSMMICPKAKWCAYGGTKLQ